MFGSAKDERLMKYGGSDLTDITPGFQANSSTPWINEMIWNGEYWLLSYPASPGNLKILRYEGANFTEPADIPEYAMLTIFGWTGEYWLIGTAYSTSFGILKYYGVSVVDLTEEFLNLRFPKASSEAESDDTSTSPPEHPLVPPRPALWSWHRMDIRGRL
jgi:hypothetical protein